MIQNDNSQRFTENEAKLGKIGVIAGAQVVKTAINLIKSQK